MVECRIHTGSPIIPILSRINPIPRISLKFTLILSSHLHLDIYKGHFPVGLPLILATCPPHFNLLELIRYFIIMKIIKYDSYARFPEIQLLFDQGRLKLDSIKAA